VSADRPEPIFLTPARKLIIAAFINDLAVAMVGISVQFVGNDLGATPTILGLLGTVSALAYTIGCLFTGRLSDRIGRRRVTAASCLLCAGVWVTLSRAGSPMQLLAIFPLSGAAVSMFWPPLQAWLSEVTVGGRRRLVRNIGAFNVSWTIGLMLGPPIAGFAWVLGSTVPFIMAAAAVLGTLVLLSVTAPRVAGGGEAAPEDAVDDHPEAAVARQFLYLAWIANFASWFGRGLNGVVFPKLGLDLGMTEATVGLVVSALLAGQLIVFLLLRTRSGWRYRLWPMTASLGVGMLGYVLAWFAHSPVAFAASFALSGMGAGVTYVASLYYSLEGGAESRGGRTGIHEAVLGSGLFLGPLLGGIVGEYFDLRAPYIATAIVFAATAIVMHIAAARMRHNHTAAQARAAVGVMGE